MQHITFTSCMTILSKALWHLHHYVAAAAIMHLHHYVAAAAIMRWLSTMWSIPWDTHHDTFIRPPAHEHISSNAGMYPSQANCHDDTCAWWSMSIEGVHDVASQWGWCIPIRAQPSSRHDVNEHDVHRISSWIQASAAAAAPAAALPAATVALSAESSVAHLVSECFFLCSTANATHPRCRTTTTHGVEVHV